MMREHLGLTVEELWLRYVALGGLWSRLGMEAVVHGALRPSDLDHELLVTVLYNRAGELDGRGGWSEGGVGC
jgi:hypothetical protein